MLQERIGRAEALLEKATKATGIVNARAMVKAGAGMEDINAQGQDWNAALVFVRQAAAEMAATKKLADDMKGAVAAKKKGDEAMVPAALPEALKALRKEVEAAKQADHADIVPELFSTMETGLTEADKLVKSNDILGANAQFQTIGAALVKAKLAQADHARFVGIYDPLKVKADALTTSTVPLAATIKDKTDPLVAALKTALEQDKAQDWDKAFEALRTAEVAETVAKQASDDRKAYDAKAKEITDKANGLGDSIKNPVLDIVAKATKAAEGFNFVHAMRFLQNAEARLDGEDVKNLAKATPLEIGKIEAAVDKMLKAKGGEELLARSTDSSVQPRNPQQAGKRIPARQQKTPNGPELLDQIVKGFDDTVPVEVIVAICKKRFDIDFSVSSLRHENLGGGKTALKDDVTGGINETNQNAAFSERSKTARKLYDTLAMTPEQSDRNPSVKAVQRLKAWDITYKGDGTTDAVTESAGGWYEANTNKSVMKGRPGRAQYNQGFGKDLNANDGTGKMLPQAPPKPWDEKTTKEQKELEVYEPADMTACDYFEFANVHETGHGVDDRLNFMVARLGNITFGGWQQHGGNFGQVATPVAEHYAGQAKVKDVAKSLEQYIIDLMIGGSPEVPTVDEAKQKGVNEACDKIKTEWIVNALEKSNPWWSQSKCDKITMSDGRIYQEAYAGVWVSYPAAERKKGITGYQFRAPGEWFAELFSAYHNEKLKPGHPARKWLSSLQL